MPLSLSETLPEDRSQRQVCCCARDLEGILWYQGAKMTHMPVLDFKVFLEPDETGGYVVSCPSLQGCYSQGETIEEALANIREAIQLCLDELRERGEPLPDPSNVLIGSVVVSE